jgi:hypothetical protein
MESAVLQEKQATISESFTLQGYIESGEFSYPLGKAPIRLKALFAREAAAYLHDTPAPGTLSLTDYDEATVLLEAEVADSRQLRWWLRGFGDEVVYGHSVAQHIDYDLNSALQKNSHMLHLEFAGGMEVSNGNSGFEGIHRGFRHGATLRCFPGCCSARYRPRWRRVSGMRPEKTITQKEMPTDETKRGSPVAVSSGLCKRF